ncbi:unnamed protein product [Schistosoma bovis]|nr:unnamed protein product [Schistosoma bovis]
MPIFACASALDPLCSSMMMFKYVKIPTSSTVYLSSTISLVLTVLYFRVLHVPLCMLRSTALEAAAGMLSDPAASHLLIFPILLLIYSIFGEVTGGLYVLI